MKEPDMRTQSNPFNETKHTKIQSKIVCIGTFGFNLNPFWHIWIVTFAIYNRPMFAQKHNFDHMFFFLVAIDVVEGIAKNFVRFFFRFDVPYHLQRPKTKCVCVCLCGPKFKTRNLDSRFHVFLMRKKNWITFWNWWMRSNKKKNWCKRGLLPSQCNYAMKEPNHNSNKVADWILTSDYHTLYMCMSKAMQYNVPAWQRFQAQNHKSFHSFSLLMGKIWAD